jgi:hypothetical protein
MKRRGASSEDFIDSRFGVIYFDEPQTKMTLGSPGTLTFTANEVVSLFILTMPPWEIDEIGCVFFTLRNRLEADWEEIVGLNSLDEVPEDTPEEEEWSLMEELFHEQYNALSSIINNGLVFSYNLLRQVKATQHVSMLQAADPAVRHIEWLLTDHQLGYPNNICAELWPFNYPASEYNCTSLEEFEEILALMPLARRPSPCWQFCWARFRTRCTSYLHNMLLQGAEINCWGWGYAFWDEHRIREWNVPDDSEYSP